MKVCWTLNRQTIIKKDLHFGLIFLPCWLDSKLKSLSSLLRVYKVYLESTKKRIYSRVNSQWVSEFIYKFVRVKELIQEFDNHDSNKPLRFSVVFI